MKLFFVTSVCHVGYDEYDGAVIAAESKGNAKKLADTLPVKKPYRCNYLGETKGSERIILSSFNAG